MSVEAKVCRAYLDVMDIVSSRIEADLVIASRQGTVDLDDHALKQTVGVIKATLLEVTNNGVTGIASAARGAVVTKKTKRKK